MRIEKFFSSLFISLLFASILWGFGWIALGANFSYPNAEDLGIAANFNQLGFTSCFSKMLIYNDGRYSANAFHGISPLVWSTYRYYLFLPVFSVLLFWVSLFILFKSLLDNFKNSIAAIFSGVSIVALFSVFISTSATIYCWGGTLVYVYPCSFTLLWIGFIVYYFHTARGIYFVLSALSLFVSTGFNEMFLGLTPVLLLLLFLYTFFFEKKELLTITSLIAVGLSGICLLVFAPGSSQKIGSNFSISERLLDMSFWGYFLNHYKISAAEFFSHTPIWTSILFLGIAIAGYLKKEKLNNSKLIFFLIASLSVLISTLPMALIFFLPMAAMGEVQERVFTPIYVLLFVSTVMLLGITVSVFIKKVYPLYKNIMLAILACIHLIGLTAMDGNYKSIKRAYLDGETSIFASQMEHRFTMFESAARTDNKWKKVSIPALNSYPKIIYYPTEPEPNRKSVNWNFAYEEYFKLDEVLLIGDTLVRF